MKRLVLVSVLGLLFLAALASGQVMRGKRVVEDASYLRYEGTLTDPSGNPVSGVHEMTFRIYDSTSSLTPVWEEVQQVAVDGGVFEAILGKGSSVPRIDGSDYYIGVFVDGEELLPRHRIAGDSKDSGLTGSGIVGGPEAINVGLPPGTSGQTLRHDGTSWVPDSLLFNNGANVGIGVTNLLGKLHVKSDDGKALYVSSSWERSWADQVTFNSSIDPSATYPWFGLAGAGLGAHRGGIAFRNTGGSSGSTGDVAIWARHGGNVLLNAGVPQAGDGNVGIGTTSPFAKLHTTDPDKVARLYQPGNGAAQRSIGFDMGDMNDIFVGSVKPSPLTRHAFVFTLSNYDDVEDGQSAFRIIKAKTTNSKVNIYDPSSYGNILYANNNGKIGIGTASPSYKLDVNGDIKTNGNIVADSWNDHSIILATARKSIRSMADPDGRVIFYTHSYQTNPGWDFRDLLYDASRVWISGSTGDIVSQGFVRGEDGLCIGADCRDSWPSGGGGGIGGGGVTDYIPKFTSSEAIANSVIYQSGNSIGIGTTTPGEKLHVAGGGLRVGYPGELSIDASGIIGGRLKILDNGNVGIGENSPDKKLVVNDTNSIVKDVEGNVIDWGEVITSNNSGSGAAIYAKTSSSTDKSAAIVGEATSTSSANIFGVQGISHSSTNNSTGSTAGVYGLNDRTGSVGDVFGVLGEINGAGGAGPGPNAAAGVYGVSYSSTGLSYGVIGDTQSTTTDVAGVYGIAKDSTDTGRVHGVVGVTESKKDYSAGVKGVAVSHSGITYGVYGRSDSPAGYGGYFDGGLRCVNGDITVQNGNKQAVVSTSQGKTSLYCQESTEIWFEDFGEGKLSYGSVHIDLDPLYLETVTIDSDHPMKVFIQLNDDCNGVFVSRGATGFDVIELRGGRSDASFSYRVVAKRKGYEDSRLELADISG